MSPCNWNASPARGRKPDKVAAGQLHPFHQRIAAFLAFAIAVHKVIGAVASQQGELYQLFLHIDDPVVKGVMVGADSTDELAVFPKIANTVRASVTLAR